MAGTKKDKIQRRREMLHAKGKNRNKIGTGATKREKL